MCVKCVCMCIYISADNDFVFRVTHDVKGVLTASLFSWVPQYLMAPIVMWTLHLESIQAMSLFYVGCCLCIVRISCT
jgi:hypothetical protein